MNINKKRLVTAMMQVSLLVPLSMGLAACGGSDSDNNGGEGGYEKPVKPLPVDKNDPTTKDKNGKTESVFSFIENENNMTTAYVDKASKVAVLNLKPDGDAKNALDVNNISLYSKRVEASEKKDFSATLIDSPDMLYSGAATLMPGGEDDEDKVVTTNQLNSQAEDFLRSLQKNIGSEFDIKVNAVKNGYNNDGSTVTLTGSIKRKDGKQGVHRSPMLHHKRMRDEMLAAQTDTPVWTKPPLASNWGTANAESKELQFSVTTWGHKGSTYLWVSAYDISMIDSVDAKFGRYNTASSLSSIENYLDSSQNVDKNNPALSDTLGKTERVYYLPKDGEGKTSGYNDNIGQVSLLNIQPNGDSFGAITPENLSLYRLPRSGVAFETGVAITKENALGAILLDDPQLLYSGAGTVVIEDESENGEVGTDALYDSAQSYLTLLKERLGNENQIQVVGVERTNNTDGDVVSLSGTIKRNGGISGDKYPMLQHKRLRDEMLAVQFNKEVWTAPTLKSNWGIDGAESSELKFTITTWTYKGSTYLWVSTYDKSSADEVKAKYGRYNSGKDLSSVHHALVANDEIDDNDPSVVDKTSKTEQVYYFLKDPNGKVGDYVDSVSKVALRDVRPTSNANSRDTDVAPDINVSNVSLLRLPKSGAQFPDGVAITPDTAIGSILLDDPELLYSGAGTMISESSSSDTIKPSTLSDNANNFFNILKYRLGKEYDVKVNDVERHENIDGLTITLRGSIKRIDGLLGADKFPVMQHKRMRDEMLISLYNRPIWTIPTLKSNWGASNSESKELEFTVTTWAYKGGTYLWTSAYDKKMVGDVNAKYGRFNKGVDLSSSIHSLKLSEGTDEDED